MEIILFMIFAIFLCFIVLFIDKTIKKLTWADYLEKIVQESKERTCRHEKWNCDTQIRRIECCKCGKRSWIEDYKDLYTNKKD
jgi:hypothetical protein